MPLRAFVLRLAALLIAWGTCPPLRAEQPARLPEPAAPAATASPALAQKHMIAAANPLAAQAGLETLRRGGTAVDAAIATQLVLTLVEPESSGIGGGAFLLFFDKQTGRTTAYDGRETAPRAAKPDRFLRPDGKPLPHGDAVVGGLSVGVPGVPALLWKAHQEHGKLPWKDLFAPAIRLAETGFTVSPRLHESIAGEPKLGTLPGSKDYFYPGGQPLAAGAILKNPEYAKTLRRMAEGDPQKTFYRGPIAKAVVNAVHRAPVHPGDMTVKDFAAYQVKTRDILCAPYRDAWKVCGMPPPSSGGLAVLQSLGILQTIDLAPVTPGSAQEVHLITEAERLAFADRNLYVGDPDFVDVPVAGLLDPAYLKTRAGLIAPDKAMETVPAGKPERMKQGWRFVPAAPMEIPATSHLSVVDDAGNAVSMTTSVEGPFGSHLMAAGFVLNNELTDFSFLPAGEQGKAANAVAGGKRPMSSMSPTLVFDKDGALKLVVGSPGGPFIISYVVQTLIGRLDRGLSLQRAIDAPRHVALVDQLFLEQGTPLTETAPILQGMGHKVKIMPLVSGLYGIALTPQGMAGGADPRREGVAIGD